MARSRLLKVEHLEERCVLNIAGVAWPDSEHLTISFVPDGTKTIGQASQLNRTLNALMDTPVWRTEILRAYQTWSSQSNINLGIVDDSGQQLGVAGLPQRDSRFGDIRVSGFPLPDGTLASEQYPEVVGGTWAGDAILNTTNKFGIGAGTQQQQQYDLFTVMLHEAGHALGLEHHHGDPGSAMYDSYQGVRTGISADDIKAIQSVYGVRAQDDYDEDGSNQTAATASTLRLEPQDNDNSNALSIEADITSRSDVDFYQIRNLTDGKLSVQLQTASVSLLVGRLTLYENSTPINTVVSAGPMGGNIRINLNSVKANATYYVKVESASSDVFGIGSYRLNVSSGANATAAETDLEIPVYKDGHSDDVLATSTNLNRKRYTTDLGYAYALGANISDANDVDFYKFTANKLAAGATNAMLVMVWPFRNSSLSPKINLYDSRGAKLNSEVLVNEDGSYVVQVQNALSEGQYVVEVRAAESVGSNRTGSYLVAVQFRPNAVKLADGTGKSFADTAATDTRTLNVLRSKLIHFVLSARSTDPATQADVELTIRDDKGAIVYHGVARTGETISTNLFLTKGKYTFNYVARPLTVGGTLSSLVYKLQSLNLGNGLGPALVITGTQPTPPTTPPDEDEWS